MQRDIATAEAEEKWSESTTESWRERPLLSARGITQRFGDVEVLHGIDLAVPRGELLALTGASGSGKSTLLEALSGLERPSSGRVELQGEVLTDLSDKDLTRLRLTQMGFVFQQIRLLPSLTLLENVLLPGIIAGAEPRATVLERGRELMDRLGVAHLAHRTVDEASGGQLQRVGICRALIARPQILFADEPTGALDSAATDSLMDALEALNSDGMTVLLVTHDPGVAQRAHRVLEMRDGLLIGAA